ncbi:MAG: FadR/GntR family transcriptional regulator [Actinomycetota bacterium]
MSKIGPSPTSDRRSLFGLGTVRMPKTADVVAARLRTTILAQGIAPGTPLPGEKELITEFKVSRASIREALRILEAEGIIEVRRGVRGGVFTAAPSAHRLTRGLATLLAYRQVPLSHLLDMRSLLEPEAAGLAAEKASAEEREHLLELARSSHNNDMVDHVDFHDEVARLSGNGLLSLFITAMRDIVAEVGLATNLPEPALKATKRAHVQIAQAIASANGDLARKSMERHMRAYTSQMLAACEADDPIVSWVHPETYGMPIF